ncbi:hypothetical protein [Rhodococcus sp. KBS0724]|jgi:hypothetical protein|nr:hypothetical protein [Rhodococcus sp. KBS0724]
MGSIDVLNWLHEGASAGDPIRGPLYVVAFIAIGLVSVLSGGAVI